ncbi:hypothetical protein [Flavobacterium ginsenosidimutans]|uniref:hypothetical protein n=1 Tax=Flavobacterium ginsenosidimutans TaxID=687844 RepID=UPI000DAC81C2|nr:hypothetical protein [Flavobacterium ginsenosidimutans]KAF2328093.1 hypothetical protein DM444_20070 [Flavobacterium ginsenosidimutans]
MEELYLKIEADSNYLKEFQQFLYDNDPDLIVNETYKHETGFNKEPVITSIIIALGGSKVLSSVQGILRTYTDHKESMLKEKNRHAEKMLQLSLKYGKSGYEEISKDNFLQYKGE